jgi:oligopeptide transport system ATP-binding protein
MNTAPPAGPGKNPTDALLSVSGLKKHFRCKRTALFTPPDNVYAVDGVDFTLRSGEILGLVGESGCGKSTLGRAVLRLIEPTAGTVTFEGRNVTLESPAGMKRLRAKMQIIFQDPYSSLNPRLTVESIIGDALRAHGDTTNIKDRVVEMLGRVGIPPEKARAYPHEFSGGQRQRIGIARALIVNPRLVVCDEPVSALDVSIQAQVLNLLIDLKRDFQLSYLMISHDMRVVNHIADRIAVMYLGKIVELAKNADLLQSPKHPYTQTLLSAVPVMNPDLRDTGRRRPPKGEPPSPMRPPAGCRFHPRCPDASEICGQTHPRWAEAAPGHFTACHHFEACRP